MHTPVNLHTLSHISHRSTHTQVCMLHTPASDRGGNTQTLTHAHRCLYLGTCSHPLHACGTQKCSHGVHIHPRRPLQTSAYTHSRTRLPPHPNACSSYTCTCQARLHTHTGSVICTLCTDIPICPSEAHSPLYTPLIYTAHNTCTYVQVHTYLTPISAHR